MPVQKSVGWVVRLICLSISGIRAELIAVRYWNFGTLELEYSDEHI